MDVLAVPGISKAQGDARYTRPALPPTPSGAYFFTTSQHNAGTSAALNNGVLRLLPWLVTQPLSIVRLGAEVTAAGDAGSKFRIAVYDDAGNNYPGALRLDAGQIAGDSATVQELTVALTLPPNLYWVGGAVQSVTTTQPTFRVPAIWCPPVPIATGTAIPAAGTTAIGYNMAGITGAAPSTFTATVSSGGNGVRIFAKAA